MISLEKKYKTRFLSKKLSPNEWFSSCEKSSKSLRNIFFEKKFF